VMVGDRGMITTARIDALRNLPAADGFGWLTCLRAPAIAALAADGGPLQMSLFDQQDLAEITHPDYPGERLVACRNPVLAEERARKRETLLAATEKLLAPIAARVAAGRLAGAAKIGAKVGEAIGKYKMAKHFDVTITDASLTAERKQAQIEEEVRLDGIYVIRTPVPGTDLDAAGTVTAYKNLKYVERDFRHIKSDDLDLRPVFHRLERRVRGHVLISMLAAYLTWHLRQAWAPLTYTDEEPPQPANPVAPARRSAPAEAKASRQHDQDGRPPPQLPRAARPPGHPHPQRTALRRHSRLRERVRGCPPGGSDEGSAHIARRGDNTGSQLPGTGVRGGSPGDRASKTPVACRPAGALGP
jgi:hypothetical protein